MCSTKLCASFAATILALLVCNESQAQRVKIRGGTFGRMEVVPTKLSEFSPNLASTLPYELQTTARLLLLENVRADLNFSDNQNSELLSLLINTRREILDARSADREAVNSPPDRATRVADLAKKRSEAVGAFEEKLGKLLDPSQMDRLKEIRLQQGGYRALIRKETTEALGLTVEQNSKIFTILGERTVMLPVNGSWEQSALGRLETLINELSDEDHKPAAVLTVLNEEQKLKLSQMTGDEFKFPDLPVDLRRVRRQTLPDQADVVVGPPEGWEQLLRLGNVCQDIGFTDDQREKLSLLYKQARDELSEDMQKDFSDRLNRADVREQLTNQRRRKDEIRQRFYENLQLLLTKTQAERLSQLRVQSEGARSLLRDSVAASLGMSAEQQAAVRLLARDMSFSTGSARSGSEMSDKQRHNLLTELVKERDKFSDELLKVLNDEQKQKLEQLKGPALQAPTVVNAAAETPATKAPSMQPEK